MRFLILAHAGDDLAYRVYLSLVERHGAEAVRLVADEALSLAPSWRHSLGPGPEAGSEVILADGTVLAPATRAVVFNRLRYVALPHFALAQPEDRDYAVMETYALWLSWLAALPCPVVNPVATRGLGLQQRSTAEWLLLAGRAGLPVADFFFSTDPRHFRREDLAAYGRTAAADALGNPVLAALALPQVARQPTFYFEPPADGEPARRVLVAGEQAVGALGGRYAGPLQRLRTLAGCELLEVTFGRTAAGAWRVYAVSPYPLAAEPAGLEAIVALLEARSARR